MRLGSDVFIVSVQDDGEILVELRDGTMIHGALDKYVEEGKVLKLEDLVKGPKRWGKMAS